MGPEHPDVAMTLTNLGFYYVSIRAYEQAHPLYQRALYIQEKVLGPQHPEVAKTQKVLALLNYHMGA